MVYNTVYLSHMYDFAAELDYFKADLTKKNKDEIERVGREIHLYCAENRIPIEVFGLTLENRVKEQRKQVKRTEQREQTQRIEQRKQNLQTEQRKQIQPTKKQEGRGQIGLPYYDYKKDDDDEEYFDLLFYKDPGPDSDCADWNDDWDGAKY